MQSVDNFDLAMGMNGNGQENGDGYMSVDHVSSLIALLFSSSYVLSARKKAVEITIGRKTQ